MINRREKFIILAVFLGLSFLLYGNSLGGNFVSDDRLIILQNPFVSGNFTDFFRAFSAPYYHNQPHAGLYRPLITASFNLNKFFGSGTFSFHFFNVVLNALNAFLVFLLVSKLMPGKKKVSFLAAVFFIFLPIHSEAVSAIAGRAELLMFLFSAISFMLVLNKKYALASLALLAGLLSKETAAGFFLVFLYLWKFREQKTLKQVAVNSSYFIPSIGIYAAMRVLALGKYFIGFDHLMAYNPLKFAPFFQSLWTSLKVFYLYLLKSFVPYQLSHDYSFNQIPVIQNPLTHFEVFASAAILASLIYIMFRKKGDILGLSAAILLFTYLPVSNWIVKIGTIMGERLMYAPSLGLIVLIASLFHPNSKLKTPNSKSRFSILLATYCLFISVLLVWYGYVIIDRNRDWRTEKSLLISGYQASPNSVISINNMAFLAFNDGKYKETIEWAGKATKILPDHMPAIFLTGHAYKKLSNDEMAEKNWIRTAELSSNYPPVYLSLGILYYEQGRLEEAEKVLGKGFELERTWGKLFPLTLVKINRGKYDEAVNLIINNFGTNPSRKELKFALGLAYLKKGDKQKAEFYLSQVKEPSVKIEDYFKQVINQKVFKITEY